MGYSVYPEYKTTELGVTHPKSWSFERLRFSVMSNPVKSEVSHWKDDTLVSFIPMEAVGEYGGIDLSKEKAIGDVYGGYTYFANGDVVIAKITPCFENGKGAIAHNLSNGVAFGTTEFHVVRPLKGISQKWLFYLTMSHIFRNLGASEMVGAGGQKRVPETFIKDFRTGIPSPLEQQKIADFLDWKTGQIDALIAKKKLLIEKLKEKRIALITHAVTKGLNPNAKMKDSGIPWLGEVPEHWYCIRTRFLCDMTTGERDTQDAEEQGEYPFFVRSDTIERISTWSFDGEGVLTSGDGAGVGKIFHHYTGKMEIHQRVYLFYNFQRLLGRYFYYFLKENLFKVALEGGAKSTVDSLRRPLLQDFPITVPPLEEQKKIISLIDNESDKLDSLITKNRQLIEKLTEYRTALITAATTGKIDVRGVEIGGAA